MVFVPLFPSKIALCSHVPTHFRYLFPFVIFRILFPCSPKMANVPLFPSIFCQCSLVPQNPWETLNVHWLPTTKKGRGSVRRCINILQMEMVLISTWLSLGMSLHFCTHSMTARPIALASSDHMNIIIIFVSITHQAVRMLLSSRTLDSHWTRQYWAPASLPAASCKMQPTARQ